MVDDGLLFLCFAKPVVNPAAQAEVEGFSPGQGVADPGRVRFDSRTAFLGYHNMNVHPWQNIN
jgi:hypothetical protein